MSKISSDIQSLQNSSIQKIEKALKIALVKIEQATEKKVQTAKQVYWFAGVVAFIVGICVVFLAVIRTMDKNTIAEYTKIKPFLLKKQLFYTFSYPELTL